MIMGMSDQDRKGKDQRKNDQRTNHLYENLNIQGVSRSGSEGSNGEPDAKIFQRMKTNKIMR